MATNLKPSTSADHSANGRIPPLETGDHLSRNEFERRYAAMAGLTKAELLEGIVYMPSPVRQRSHSRPSRHLGTWLGHYEAATLGVEGGDNATVRLDLENEPQPDAILFIDAARSGQARISTDDYLEGAPEWVGEVSASTVSIDLHAKFRVYQRNGVKEYLVWRVLDREIDWFVLRPQGFERLAPGPDGILRSEVFPGLWLDAPAMIRADLAHVLAILGNGIASAEHGEFVRRLNPPSR